MGTNILYISIYIIQKNGLLIQIFKPRSCFSNMQPDCENPLRSGLRMNHLFEIKSIPLHTVHGHDAGVISLPPTIRFVCGCTTGTPQGTA